MDCAVAELQQEYCVDRLTAEHMVMASRYAVNGAADLTAAVRRAVGADGVLSRPVNRARVAGVCHVFDVYDSFLADGFESMREAMLRRSPAEKRQFRRMERAVGGDLRLLRSCSSVLSFFAPYTLARRGEMLWRTPRDRSGLVDRVARIFRAAHALGARCDSDLARCAVTLCDNKALAARPQDELLQELQGDASADANYHVRHCRFGEGLFKGLLRENVRRLWLADLAVLPTMLRRYIRLREKGSVYVPYESSIATLFAMHCGACTAQYALQEAQKAEETGWIGSWLGRPERILLKEMVEKHRRAIVADRSGIPLVERVEDP